MLHTMQVTITDIGFGGDGVARLDDHSVVFVPFTAMGDVAQITLLSSHKNYHRAMLRNLITAGHGRTAPVCPHFGTCGGCAYQHLDYAAECQAKQRQFRDIMERIGHFKDFPQPEPIIPSPSCTKYRNKLRLEPIRVDRETLAYGYYAQDNRTLIPVKSCPLAQDCLNLLLRTAINSPWGKKNTQNIRPYPLTLRATTNGSCQYYFGPPSAKVPWLHEELLGEDINVPLGSFWQVNPPVAEKLVETVRRWATESGTRSLIDAYGGVGTFSLLLGSHFQYRVLIESDPLATAAAERNHQERDLKCRILSSTTESSIGTALSHVTAAETLVLLDPPRTGCAPKVIEILRHHPPLQIIYVSCNPPTLARDLQLLCADGVYTPIHAATFDMFPRTGHFESAVLLERTTNGKHA